MTFIQQQMLCCWQIYSRPFKIRAQSKLDPAHFYTAPGLTQQALLKTGSEYCKHDVKRKDCASCVDEFRLELLTDIDMLVMFEKDIQRGIPQTVKRYTKANYRYMKEHYSPYKASTFLQYFEVNNLCGCPLNQNYQEVDLLRKKQTILPLRKK